MSATDRLAESEAITAASTEGPWVHGIRLVPRPCYVAGPEFVDTDGELDRLILADRIANRADAEFIVHARSALPKRDAALRAVLALHSEAEWVCGDKWCSDFPHGGTNCVACGSEYPDYPCPTVRAIEEALA